MNGLHFGISNTIQPSDSTFDDQMVHNTLMHRLINIVASKFTGKAFKTVLVLELPSIASI